MFKDYLDQSPVTKEEFELRISIIAYADLENQNGRDS